MFINYEFLRSSILNKILALIFILIFPIHAYAGFPEGENGYELKKIEQSFKLPCSEIGKDKCLARVISMGGCIYSFEINKGKNNEDALRKSVKDAKKLGFDGKGCIHPRQIKPIHEEICCYRCLRAYWFLLY